MTLEQHYDSLAKCVWNPLLPGNEGVLSSKSLDGRALKGLDCGLLLEVDL